MKTVTIVTYAVHNKNGMVNRALKLLYMKVLIVTASATKKERAFKTCICFCSPAVRNGYARQYNTAATIIHDAELGYTR